MPVGAGTRAQHFAHRAQGAVQPGAIRAAMQLPASRAMLDYSAPMRAVRRRLRACAWLALLSIVALAAGPTVSRLLLPVGGSLISGAATHSPVAHPTSEPTSSLQAIDSWQHHQHAAMAAAAAPAPSHSPAHGHTLEHCGLCLLAAHAFTFVQENPALTGLVECTSPATDRTVPAVPRLRCDWSPASSRGPPPLA